MDKRKFVIAIDFDGTIVENKYPMIGKLKDGVREAINKLVTQDNCEVIIWTCREGDFLKDVVFFLTENSIPYHYLNDNCDWAKKEFYYNANCRKVFADLYIDDKAIFSDIDWNKIYDEIIKIKNSSKQFI